MVENISESTDQKINIEDEMRSSYLDYAMSVIIGRALPDVRDGLKPVHRRILFAMYSEGLLHNKKYSKCAGVVGEVLKKYHPHGDMAVYDSLVRMAQRWNMRYPLVDGQGNFGSVDGDPAAAYRYTEARMAKLAEELLANIEQDTVDFAVNFDGSTEEPTVLPARFPNLLVNGSTGIAVGMATNIPPHNLGEVVDATIYLIRNPEATVEDLMQFIPGPDFPTAGFICGKYDIRQAYKTGRGILSLRSRSTVEVDPKTHRSSIVITEIPYQVNKSKMVEKIAELVRDKKIIGISDIRDESDRQGMRVVVELKKDAIADVVTNQLYKHTPLQSSFGIIMLTIVGGQPRLLDLKQVLEQYISHRREVTRRRCAYELTQAKNREHLLEGYQIALDHLDEIIKLIRAAKDPNEARQQLISAFNLSKIQAQAILEMRLQRLTGLERDKVINELEQVRKEIKRLEEILQDLSILMGLIIGELEDIKKQYSNDRRTEIIAGTTRELTVEDLLADEDHLVTVSHAGYIKRNSLNLYRRQHRGGRGRTGMHTRNEDFVSNLFIASTHSTFLVITKKGRAYALKVYMVPEAGPAAKGSAIVNLLRLHSGEQLASIVPVRSFEDQSKNYLCMVTRRGFIKKTELKHFSNINVAGIIAMGIGEEDELIGASITTGQQEILIGTRAGMAVRFKESDIRSSGRTSRGVRGIRLRADRGKSVSEEEASSQSKRLVDKVVGMEVVDPGATILTVSSNGYGKRSETEEYRLTARGGVGVKTCRITEKTGEVVGLMQVSEDDDVMLVTDGGMIIRTNVNGISLMGRDTQGVRLIDLKSGEAVVGLARLVESEEPEEEPIS